MAVVLLAYTTAAVDSNLHAGQLPDTPISLPRTQHALTCGHTTARPQFDWFHGWPLEALVSVAQRFLSSIPDVEPAVRDALGAHMAHAHTCVSEASAAYLKSARRYNYTTPKSYLELISLYKELLARKRRVRGGAQRLHPSASL